MIDDPLARALRDRLQAQRVPFDEDSASAMIRSAALEQPLDARNWQAPMAAAAVIVAVGGGAGAIAATHIGSHPHHVTPAGGGPVSTASPVRPTLSAVPLRSTSSPKPVRPTLNVTPVPSPTSTSPTRAGVAPVTSEPVTPTSSRALPRPKVTSIPVPHHRHG